MASPLAVGLASSAKGPAASAFQQALAGSRVCVAYTLKLPNGFTVPCAITIPGSELLLDIEGQVRAEMEQRGLPVDLTTQGNFELARARRTLMHAVRVWDERLGPDAPQLGSLSEWGQLSPETIGAAYARFGELRELHDPMSDDAHLSELDVMQIRSAITEKKTATLRYCGLNMLIAYLLTTADQHAPSPTPKPEPGPSSLES